MWKIFIQNNRTFGPIYQRMSRHPAWVTRTAITCTLAVIVVPLIVLIMFGLLLGFVVFTLLSAVSTVMGWFGVGDQGRQNVRVVEDEVTNL